MNDYDFHTIPAALKPQFEQLLIRQWSRCRKHMREVRNSASVSFLTVFYPSFLFPASMPNVMPSSSQWAFSIPTFDWGTTTTPRNRNSSTFALLLPSEGTSARSGTAHSNLSSQHQSPWIDSPVYQKNWQARSFDRWLTNPFLRWHRYPASSTVL